MITLNCFENFKCTNKTCSDNCCIGWEIDIDEDTKKYYNSLESEFGKRIKSNISIDTPCHFIMDKNGRCPFLNKDNLCDIILTLGEDKIPYICKNHPRFYEWLSDRTEMGIGLACEEGARLLFNEPDGIKLNFEPDCTADIYTRARSTAFLILQLRKLSFNKRLIIFLDFAFELDDLLFMDEIKEAEALCDKYENIIFLTNEKISTDKTDLTEEFCEFFGELEPIDESWNDFLNLISEYSDKFDKKDFLSRIKLYEYENLAVYYVFRYFMKARADNDVLSKAKLAVISVIFNILMDLTTFTCENKIKRISNAKLYSKELEYSEENLNFIYNEIMDNDLFSYDSLIKYINYLFNDIN